MPYSGRIFRGASSPQAGHTGGIARLERGQYIDRTIATRPPKAGHETSAVDIGHECFALVLRNTLAR